MNKLIEKLAEQATLKWAEEVPGGVQEMEFFDKEKFAELLIRETMQVVANNMSADLYRVVANAVIEHYGDEE